MSMQHFVYVWEGQSRATHYYLHAACIGNAVRNEALTARWRDGPDQAYLDASTRK